MKDFALLLKPEGPFKKIKPKGKYFTLKELQDAVGGNIEIYPYPYADEFILVNEEGALLDLEYNINALDTLGIEVFGNVLIVPRAIFEEPEDDEDCEELTDEYEDDWEVMQ